jgi:hypothetical protein
MRASYGDRSDVSTSAIVAIGRVNLVVVGEGGSAVIAPVLQLARGAGRHLQRDTAC